MPTDHWSRSKARTKAAVEARLQRIEEQRANNPNAAAIAYNCRVWIGKLVKMGYTGEALEKLVKAKYVPGTYIPVFEKLGIVPIARKPIPPKPRPVDGWRSGPVMVPDGPGATACPFDA